MDLSFLDNADIRDDISQFTPNEQELLELQQLAEIAEKIGSYTWVYDENAPKEAQDGQLHDGIVAQQLLEVPGLKAAVHEVPNEDGNGTHLEVDTKFVSLATLGYVAALTRLLIKCTGGDIK